MTKTIYKHIDLSDKRKVYAVGDIHGCYDKLRTALANVDFDGNKDALISLGDLVDRGPQNLEAVEWIKHPWFHRVLGNHELMTMEHALGESYLHTMNGGGWMEPLTPDEKRDMAIALNDAPFMLEVDTPKGLNVGFVHADLRWASWQANIDNPDERTFCWSREGVKNLRDPAYEPIITGIDKVFFGHNALYNPFSRGNCSWIDTGSGFEDGKLTIVDVDTFGSMVTE
jgi:serine/threonine protein phosphatase 1